LIAEADAALTKILELADGPGVGGLNVSFHEAQPAQFDILFDCHDSRTKITGHSCNGLEGPWTVTIDTVGESDIVSGGGSGSGTFKLVGGTGPGTLEITHDVVINGVQGSHQYVLTVTPLDGVQGVTLTFQGTTTAYTPAGPFSQPPPSKT
jgi:hypothetical protein